MALAHEVCNLCYYSLSSSRGVILSILDEKKESEKVCTGVLKLPFEIYYTSFEQKWFLRVNGRLLNKLIEFNVAKWAKEHAQLINGLIKGLRVTFNMRYFAITCHVRILVRAKRLTIIACLAPFILFSNTEVVDSV